MKSLLFLTLPLFACSADAITYTVSGRCAFAGDTSKGVSNTVIQIESGAALQYVAVDTAGFYSIELEAGEYLLSAFKRTDTLNGIDSDDHFRIQQNLIGVIPFTNQWQWLASDVNGNGVSTTYDAFLVSAALIGVDYARDFIGGWWSFVPSDYVAPFQNGFYLTSPPKSVAVSLFDDMEGVNFTGYRVGDVNLNANPKK